MPPQPATDTGGTPANVADAGADVAHSCPPSVQQNQQNQQPTEINSHPDRNSVPPVLYSGAVKQQLPANRAERAAAIHNRLSGMAQFRDLHEHRDGAPVLFSHHPDDYMIAIPFDSKITDISEVALAVEAAYPAPTALAVYYTNKCAYVSFPTDEALKMALDQPMPFQHGSLPVFLRIRSIGHRISIHSDYIPIGDIEERQHYLRELFKDYGKIILFSSLYNTQSKLNRAATRFVLELHPDAPEDIEIPRVAPVKGCNVLFAWSGSPFCYRCGRDGHRREECNKASDYALWEQPAFQEPIMARVFPDPSTPLRQPPMKKNKNKETAPVAKASIQIDAQGGGGTTAAKSGKRNRQERTSSASSNTVTASDSDSGDKPMQKRGPGHPPKESKTVQPTLLIRKENIISVADVPPSSASHSLGQQTAGTPASGATEAAVPPSNSSVGATGASEGSASSTTSPSAQEEKVPTPVEETKTDNTTTTLAKDSTTTMTGEETSAMDGPMDMEGVELTIAEQVELDLETTTPERRAELMAKRKKSRSRGPLPTKVQQAVAAANAKLDGMKAVPSTRSKGRK